MIIKTAETTMNAEKQDTSRETVQSEEMAAEMEMEVVMGTVVDSTARKPVLKMETDSTAKAKAMEVVTETQADLIAIAMEVDPETEVDPTATYMEPNTEMEADTTVKVSEKILDLEAKDSVKEVKDSVKEMDTRDRSCLEMAQQSAMTRGVDLHRSRGDGRFKIINRLEAWDLGH
jgi:hypothetical protein